MVICLIDGWVDVVDNGLVLFLYLFIGKFNNLF